MTLGPPARHAMALSLAALLAGCGKSEAPSDTTPPPTAPPVTQPPAPPPPDPPPGATSCNRIGMGSNENRCAKESPSFLDQVNQAIDQLVRDKPQIFEGEGFTMRALSTGQFYVGVINNLDRMGLCAAFDGEEVGVKNSNGFNDQYQLLTSQFIVRRGPSSYQATCYPAAFPTPAPPYPPTNGCSLPSSREITCARESSQFFPDVDSALDQVAREHPDVFDLGDQRGLPGGYRITDPVRFIQFTIDAMKTRGYCGRHDGEEFVFKKQNAYTEHFDLELAQGYVRRGSGTYEATCYPAAF